MNALNVRIRKLSPDARIPTYGTEHAAGFDLYAAADVIIAPGETKLVPTGLAFEIPVGYEMQIRPRSGVTLKTKLRVQFGTIDADYRGEVSVIIDNIAQKEYDTVHDDVDNTVRGIEYAYSGSVDTLDGRYLTGYFLRGSYIIRKGDRIAQGVIAPVSRVLFTETDEELTQTERGDGGFGSTGVNV